MKEKWFWLMFVTAIYLWINSFYAGRIPSGIFMMLEHYQANRRRISKPGIIHLSDETSENEQIMKMKIRVCSQKERLEHMKRICFRRGHAQRSRWMMISNRSLVDVKHKVMMCWMSRAGCSALKALFLEAAGLRLTQKYGHNLSQVHSEKLLRQHDLRKLKNLTAEMRAEVLSSYFSFILIRHPFQRLLSTYRGKVLDPGSDFPWFGAEALKLANPKLFERNKTLAEMKAPQKVLGPPTFSQFLQWIAKSGTYNDHWSTILEACHPCAMDWSAILRLETMEQDSALLIDHLKPDVNISTIPVRHSHQKKPIHDQFAIRLPEYDAVGDDIIDHFLTMYDVDMEMFGYGWNKTTKTAYCSIMTENGPCC